MTLLDPELLPALESLLPRADPVTQPEAARAELAAKLGSGGPPHPDVERRDLTYPGPEDDPVRVRLYVPRGRGSAPVPGLFWIHGGGFLMGTIDQDDLVCDAFAARFGCIVCSVEYRLAPEDPFPAGVEDCYAGLRGFFVQAAELGVDPALIGIAGISAGGGLAAAVALLARDRGEVTLAFQMPLCAQLDDRHITHSSRSIHDTRVWNTETSIGAWRAYLGGAADAVVSPYAAPARAADLAGLPPTFLSVGQLDPFCDENLEYARRLLEAGVPTELHVYPGAFHGFDVLAPSARVSVAALAARDAALARFLHPGGPPVRVVS